MKLPYHLLVHNVSGDASRGVDNRQNIAAGSLYSCLCNTRIELEAVDTQSICSEWLYFVANDARGMGGIIGFGFRYIKYLMCIQSEPKRSVSLAVHTLFMTQIRVS